MFSSRESSVILAIYKDKRTVFRLKDIAMLTNDTNVKSLYKKLNYYVRTSKIRNPRKGIYTKPDYNTEEMACRIFAPSYISLEYVLQKSGIIFQYDSRITLVSYLHRNISIEDLTYIFRKIKGEILVNTAGIVRHDNHINIASVERAFLDLLYLDSDYYFDNINPLNKDLVYKLLPIYKSKVMSERVEKLFQYV
jgi:hypothetical protein